MRARRAIVVAVHRLRATLSAPGRSARPHSRVAITRRREMDDLEVMKVISHLTGRAADRCTSQHGVRDKPVASLAQTRLLRRREEVREKAADLRPQVFQPRRLRITIEKMGEGVVVLPSSASLGIAEATPLEGLESRGVLMTRLKAHPLFIFSVIRSQRKSPSML